MATFNPHKICMYYNCKIYSRRLANVCLPADAFLRVHACAASTLTKLHLQ